MATTSALCQSSAAGHKVHWVQAQRARGGSYEFCRVLNVEDDGWFTIEQFGEVHRLWHHDAALVSEVVVPGFRATANLQWCIVIFDSHNMSVSDTESPCVFTAPTGTPEEQIKTHGGFTISGPEALGLYGKDAE